MWPLRMLRAQWTCCLCSLCLLVIVATTTPSNPHIFSLVSMCKQYAMPIEIPIENYTVIPLYGERIDTALNCSLKLKTFSRSTISIKFLESQPQLPAYNCSTHLTLVEPGKKKLLDYGCVSPPSFTMPLILETTGNVVMAWFTIRTSSASAIHSSILFTAFHRECHREQYFWCRRGGVCVHIALRCDDLPHCPNGEDETECSVIGSVFAGAASSFVTRTTTVPTPSSSTSHIPTTPPGPPGFGSDNIDIITLVLVAVVFIVILIGCVILAFREQRYRNEEVLNDAPLELESNQNVNDGGPPTPPPTYSMIERQTSYVSHISQTSSQISVPPAYEDTVGEDEDPNSWRRRLRRHISRSTSVTLGPSRRLRLFQRSLSAQESPAPRGRHISGNSHRLRHASDQNMHQSNSLRDSSVSDSDSVFVDTPQQQHSHVISPLAGNASAPSTLGNLSEVDETLGSSLMLIGDPAPDVTSGTNVNSGSTRNVIQGRQALPNASQNASTLTQPRVHPALQRSISDVLSSQLTFSLED